MAAKYIEELSHYYEAYEQDRLRISPKKNFNYNQFEVLDKNIQTSNKKQKYNKVF